MNQSRISHPHLGGNRFHIQPPVTQDQKNKPNATDDLRKSIRTTKPSNCIRMPHSAAYAKEDHHRRDSKDNG